MPSGRPSGVLVRIANVMLAKENRELMGAIQSIKVEGNRFSCELFDIWERQAVGWKLTQEKLALSWEVKERSDTAEFQEVYVSESGDTLVVTHVEESEWIHEPKD